MNFWQKFGGVLERHPFGLVLVRITAVKILHCRDSRRSIVGIREERTGRHIRDGATDCSVNMCAVDRWMRTLLGG